MVVHIVIPELRKSQDGDLEANLGYKVRTQLKIKQGLGPLPSEPKWMISGQRPLKPENKQKKATTTK